MQCNIKYKLRVNKGEIKVEKEKSLSAGPKAQNTTIWPDQIISKH